jgi:hypothetical protein
MTSLATLSNMQYTTMRNGMMAREEKLTPKADAGHQIQEAEAEVKVVVIDFDSSLPRVGGVVVNVDPKRVSRVSFTMFI